MAAAFAFWSAQLRRQYHLPSSPRGASPPRPARAGERAHASDLLSAASLEGIYTDLIRDADGLLAPGEFIRSPLPPKSLS